MSRVDSSHLDQIADVDPHTNGCGDLRNRRGTTHFHAKHHPVIQSIEPGESRKWCFVDEVVRD